MIWIVASLVCQYASPMFALHLTTKLLAERWLSLTVNLIFLKNSSSENCEKYFQSPVWCFELAITLGKYFKIINLLPGNLKQKTWEIIWLPFGFADLLYSRWWKTANRLQALSGLTNTRQWPLGQVKLLSWIPLFWDFLSLAELKQKKH